MRSSKNSCQIDTYRPTWAEIDLDAIRYNFLQVKKLVGKATKVLVAVKANAYGHGILEVSDVLVRAGVDYLGVGTTDEGLWLRKNRFRVPVLMLGSILEDEIGPIIENNITQTVGDTRLLNSINRYAIKIGKKAKVHIKIDTGMGRIGVWHNQALGLIQKALKMKGLVVEGIFSHFSSADENQLITAQQLKDFCRLVEELEELDIHIRYRHIANSIALMEYKESHMNLVRPGLMVYGLLPTLDFHKYSNINLRPALSLKSKVIFLKDVPRGRGISYGGTYTTVRPTKVATLPIGYGDGLNRFLSNKGHVLMKGKKIPILGRICMDQIMVDATGIKSVRVGDEAVLIGSQARRQIAVEEIANLCGTIPYEVVCWFNNRVPRAYSKSRIRR